MKTHARRIVFYDNNIIKNLPFVVRVINLLHFYSLKINTVKHFFLQKLIELSTFDRDDFVIKVKFQTVKFKYTKFCKAKFLF